jgi:uncharacterized membrane protein (DUF106 family)
MAKPKEKLSCRARTVTSFGIMVLALGVSVLFPNFSEGNAVLGLIMLISALYSVISSIQYLKTYQDRLFPIVVLVLAGFYLIIFIIGVILGMIYALIM